MELLYKDRTEQLFHGFFTVQNEVGLGRSEEAYQRAFEIWAEEQDLPVFSKPPSPLDIDGHQVCILYPDFIAWHELIIELKALPRKLGPSEELQLFDYLRARKEPRVITLENSWLTLGNRCQFWAHRSSDYCTETKKLRLARMAKPMHG